MYFTSGSRRAFEQLMRGKPGFDHYDSGGENGPEDCVDCRFHRPYRSDRYCVFTVCPYDERKSTWKTQGRAPPRKGGDSKRNPKTKY